MSDAEAKSAVRFGRTMFEVVIGGLVEQSVEALIHSANSRGGMGAGPAGSVRAAAGPEVEREAMAQAPIDVGAAVLTGPGRLAERGVVVIAHAALVSTLGESAPAAAVVRAVESSLRLIDERRLRSVALPLLGLSSEAPPAERSARAEALVDVAVAHIRRPGSRLDRVVFVSRFEDDAPLLTEAIAMARQRSWTSPA
ncbi:MAG: macro domain-containing protein [Thermomicrobiales bacterium]